MEALETAISYWDDALAAYNSLSAAGAPLTVTSSEEAEFCRELQNLLDVAYRLQDQCELLFLDQVRIVIYTTAVVCHFLPLLRWACGLSAE